MTTSLRRLEELEAGPPGDRITPDSPTQRVGGKALEAFASRWSIRCPLESLQDVFDFEELRSL